MGTRVYIGGLPYRVKERDIERFFRGYGKLREILIKNGYGFVVSYIFQLKTCDWLLLTVFDLVGV
jgi:RNA recognition motif-containing protein